MYAIKCNIVKSNPVNAAKDAHMYVLKNRETLFGIQRPVVRAGVDPLCKKMAIVTFTTRKDVTAFATACKTLQKRGIGLNTGVLANDRLEFEAMETGNRWMALNVHEAAYSDLENMCIVHAINLVILREVTSDCRSLQGVEVSFDPPPARTSAHVLNRLYNR